MQNKEENKLEKKRIRKHYKTLRNEMSREEVQLKSEQICSGILQSEVFQKAEHIYGYYPLGNETDITAVIEEAWKLGKQVAFPKVFGDIMEYFQIDSFQELEEGTFGVMEPVEHRPVFWEAPLVITPGVAFDRRGNRMGFGKGYYDKYLAQHPKAVTLGVAYELQLDAELPVEDTDVPLHYMATEKGVWTPE